jgi:hypothetical protein
VKVVVWIVGLLVIIACSLAFSFAVVGAVGSVGYLLTIPASYAIGWFGAAGIHAVAERVPTHN